MRRTVERHRESRRPHQERLDRGFTLVEVLVAISLFGVLSSLLLGLALSTSAVTDEVKKRTTVTEEARAALERMTRELRQSAGLDEVILPSTPGGGPTSFTFFTDFDGDGIRSTNARDPEVMTYLWKPETQKLYLSAPTAADSGAMQTSSPTADPTTVSLVLRPVLAAKVVSFGMALCSSNWQYHSASADPSPWPPTNLSPGVALCPPGLTTWQELDHQPLPVGNGNGRPDGPELKNIDMVVFAMQVRDGTGTQDYQTTVDLRNRTLEDLDASPTPTAQP